MHGTSSVSIQNARHFLCQYTECTALPQSVYRMHRAANCIKILECISECGPLIDVVNTLRIFKCYGRSLHHLRDMLLLYNFVFVPELKIQSVTHDSIEDARTALALYQKYCQLQSSGNFKEELEALYQVGKKMQWQVPGEAEEAV